MNAAAPADPVTLEIIRNLLIAILDEGEINLSRTAFSPIVYEVKDYCIGLLDRDGRTIAQSRGGIPTFMADLGEPVRDGIGIYGHDGLHPGDVLLINYAPVCGQHLNNMVVYVPIHWEGELVGFAATRAHWTDIGGRVSGSFSTDTTEIFQEGLQVRSVKVYKRGQQDEEILRLIRHNIRFPELSLGDMAAQVAACELTARRFVDIVRKYGWATVHGCIHRIWDQSEAIARRKIAALPKGRYVAESFLDDDGLDYDRTLPIKVAVTVGADALEIDFTGTSPQTRGSMNSGRSGGLAAAKVAFKSAIVPDLPPNEGVFRALRVNLPDGTMISAVDNAAMAHWNLALKTVIDTVYLALSQALPESIPAGHHAAQGLYMFFGRDAGTGHRYNTVDTTLGGWGAQPDADGFSPLKTVTHGDTRNIPIEVEEMFYPLRCERYEWRADTGGPGEFRGGLGLRKVYRVLQDCQFVSAFERTKCPPWGLFGGRPGKTGDARVRQPDADAVQSYRKVTGLALRAGATVELLSAAGGGRGSPLARPVERVVDDVRQGYVTVEGARADYGVVIAPDTLTVDPQATEALRRAEDSVGAPAELAGKPA